MGYGSYSRELYSTRTKALGRETKTAAQIFTRRTTYNKMDPNGMGIRESRDSAEHPESIPVMIWLDVTGSMGRIPAKIAKGDLNTIMGTFQDKGMPDAQVFFGAIGDHYTDSAPVQVGQFESSDELLDYWLTNVYLERGGGGQIYESYGLAWLVAARHTATDHFEKRGQKGYLFTIGDEAAHPLLEGERLKQLFGYKEAADINISTLLKEVQERWHVYHIHVNEGAYRDNPNVLQSWRHLLGERLLICNDYHDIPRLIAETTIFQATADEVISSTQHATPPA